jgi:hypothetical protein
MNVYFGVGKAATSAFPEKLGSQKKQRLTRAAMAGGIGLSARYRGALTSSVTAAECRLKIRRQMFDFSGTAGHGALRDQALQLYQAGLMVARLEGLLSTRFPEKSGLHHSL